MIYGMMFLLVTLVPGVWAIVDAALIPNEDWARADASKTGWLTFLIVTALMGLGLVGAVAYVVVKRRHVHPALSNART